MEFEDYVRNKLRELIGKKGWSVSRFASRYVQAYADKYSKMEAPSTSTARKLIEDSKHVLSEREAIVLDSFTQMNFHELWLEEQKRQLLSKSEQYVMDKQPQTKVDSEILLEDRIRSLERVAKSMSLDDVASVVRRYINLSGSKPLVMFSESVLMIDIILGAVAPTATLLSTDKLDEIKAFPQIAYQIIDDDKDDIDSVIEHIIALNGKRSYILAVRTTSETLISSIRNKWQHDAIFFSTTISESIMLSLTSAGIEETLSPINANRLVMCLQARTDYPEIFKLGIMACINSPWVIFPEFNDHRDCMRFLDSQYRRLSIIYDDKTLSSKLVAPFLKLVKEQMPTYWLTDECDQQSLLTLIYLFDEWSKQPGLDKKAVSRLEDADYRKLILFGRVPALDSDEWEQWIQEHYNLNLFFTIDYAHYLIDNVAERLRRKKLEPVDYLRFAKSNKK